MSDPVGHSDTVRVMLLKSEETIGILSVLRDRPKPPLIVDRGTFWLVEGNGEITLDADEVADRMGRDLTIEDILVNFTSYAGRVEVDDTSVRVTADFLQLPGVAPKSPA